MSASGSILATNWEKDILCEAFNEKKISLKRPNKAAHSVKREKKQLNNGYKSNLKSAPQERENSTAAAAATANRVLTGRVTKDIR